MNHHHRHRQKFVVLDHLNAQLSQKAQMVVLNEHYPHIVQVQFNMVVFVLVIVLDVCSVRYRQR